MMHYFFCTASSFQECPWYVPHYSVCSPKETSHAKHMHTCLSKHTNWHSFSTYCMERQARSTGHPNTAWLHIYITWPLKITLSSTMHPKHPALDLTLPQYTQYTLATWMKFSSKFNSSPLILCWEMRDNSITAISGQQHSLSQKLWSPGSISLGILQHSAAKT